MNETHMVSSGTLEASDDGPAVNNIKYKIESDGKTADLFFSHNEDKYYGQSKLTKDGILELLNHPISEGRLIETLEKDFPIKKTVISKSKTRRRAKNSSNRKTKTKKK